MDSKEMAALMPAPFDIKVKEEPEQISTQIALFISKVWNIVNNSDTNDLISWSISGKTFIVHDEVRFAKEVLPHYFKHSNFASFVRQLNLYGFRKVAQPDQGALLALKQGSVEFWHTNFRQGHHELLHLVQRRSVASRTGMEEKNPNLSRVVSDIHNMKGRQENIACLLEELQDENLTLKEDVSLLKQKYIYQHKVLNKIIHFIIHMLYKGRLQTRKGGNRRLMLTDQDDLELSIPQPKRPRKTIIDALTSPDSPPPLYTVQSPALFPTIQNIPLSPPASIDPSVTGISLDTLPVTGTSLDTLPVTSLDILGTSLDTPPITVPTVLSSDDDGILASGDEFLADLFQPTTLSPQSQTTTLLTLFQSPSIQPQPALVPYERKMSHVTTHLDNQQVDIDAFPDILYGNLNIDPSLLNDFLSTEYQTHLPDYDTIDTARLLESLTTDSTVNVPHDSMIQNALIPVSQAIITSLVPSQDANFLDLFDEPSSSTTTSTTNTVTSPTDFK